MKHYLLLPIPFFLGCEEPLQLNQEEVTSINYSFNDSSVPPEYHRSYTISINPKTVRVTVDSYGDILADEEQSVSIGAFTDLIQIINDAQLVSSDIRSKEGCAGGTSEGLQIFESGAQVYTAFFDHCGGNEIPASAGNVKDVIEAIKAIVPNLNSLLE